MKKQEAYDNHAAGSMNEKRYYQEEEGEQRWRREERNEHIKKSIQDHVFNRLQDIRR